MTHILETMSGWLLIVDTWPSWSHLLLFVLFVVYSIVSMLMIDAEDKQTQNGHFQAVVRGFLWPLVGVLRMLSDAFKTIVNVLVGLNVWGEP